MPSLSKFSSSLKQITDSIPRSVRISVSWIIFIIFLLWKFPVSDLSGLFRSAPIFAGISLFFAAICFATIGAILNRFFKFKFTNPIWSLLIGQAFCSLWIYLRSGTNILLRDYAGFSIPLSYLDLITIAVLLLILSRKEKIPRISKEKLLQLLLGFIPIFAICWIVAQRELPRLSMMSSDPDLHVFWAAQLHRLHTIPDNLGLWGPEALKYPAGFAVLNYLWSSFSFQDLQQVISVQSLMQSLFAVLLIASTCTSLLRIKRSSHLLNLGLTMFLIASFYFLLPYGHQINFFHLEGTARTSCLFYLAAICIGAATLLCNPNYNQAGITVLTALICFLLIGINPINGLYAVPCYLLLCCYALWLIFFRKNKFALLTFLPPFLLPCDPYFLSGNQQNSSIALDQVTLSSSLIDGVLKSLTVPVSSLHSAYMSFFTVDFYPSTLIHRIMAGLVIIYVITRLPMRRRSTVEILTISLSCIALILLAFVIIPGLSPLSPLAQYRLLYPYAIHLSQQIVYLLLFFLFSIVTFTIFKRIGGLWLIILCIPALIIFRNVRNSSAQVRMEPRHTLFSGMGYPTPDDEVVIAQIENLYQDILARYPNLTAAQMPKILIPNFLDDLGWEQWLYPYGGSRILALHKVFPLAFYYNQGWLDFSYQNYREKVCHKFDINWLSERNVRYLFVPAQRGPICIRGLERLLQEKQILFKSGNAVFVKLF